MDIDPAAHLTELIRDASKRIDGRVAGLTMITYLIAAFTKTVINLSSGDTSFSAWKIVLASLGMMLVTPILYANLAVFSKKGSQANRVINAICLISIPIYLYFGLI